MAVVVLEDLKVLLKVLVEQVAVATVHFSIQTVVVLYLVLQQTQPHLQVQLVK